MKKFLGLASILAAFGMALALSSCSNGADDNSAFLASLLAGKDQTQSSGEGQNSNPTTTDANGGQTQNQTPATYTITFNANDGSQTPATATQSFTAGTPQTLKTIAELGFKKEGFNFAGWLIAADAANATYTDGANYAATADATLWAKWSAIPVYSANIPANEHGTITANPATGTAGTEITLSVTPNEGYELAAYTVKAADGTAVAVTDGKFTMPAQDVTVTATFNALSFDVTFNANDGSQSPATATQTFTAGTPQNLKTIAELGFKKEGFNFAGWLTAAEATEAAYADGASYTGTAAVTLWANWSAVPVYSVNVTPNELGTVTASPATAAFEKDITLSAEPIAGYELASYTVTAADGTPVAVANGKFKMPAQNVTVTAAFNAINYSVNVGTFDNGSVSANPATATVGQSVTLTASPATGYELATLAVSDADGTFVQVDGTGNSRTFTMPAKNVTVSATFSAISYNINVGSFANGRVAATPSTATIGTIVTLTANPDGGYQLDTLAARDEGGASVPLSGTGNTQTFTMPAKNVTVTATFSAINYTVTFNANDGSQSPATATQSFTAGTPQALKTIADLGFKKEGFKFAGWLTAADAAEAGYADGASYNGIADATLFAKWQALNFLEEWEDMQFLYINDDGKLGTKIDAPWNKAAASTLMPDNIRFDIKKSNGWEVAFSLLNQDGRPDMNYFGLYNKYTGVLRFFYYYNKEVAASANDFAFDVILGSDGNNAKAYFASMNYGIPMDANINEVNLLGAGNMNKTFHFLTTPYSGIDRRTMMQGWYAFDIDMSAYTGKSFCTDGSSIQISFKANNTTNVSLGTDIIGKICGDMNATIDRAQLTASSGGVGGIVSSILGFGAGLGDTTASSLRNIENKLCGGGISLLGQSLRFNDGLSYLSMAAKGCLWLYNNYIADEEEEPEPLQDKLNGKLDLKCNLTADTRGYLESAVSTNVKQITLGKTAFNPDSNIGKGVWNINTAPVIYVFSDRRIYEGTLKGRLLIPGGDKWGWQDYYYKLEARMKNNEEHEDWFLTVLHGKDGYYNDSEGTDVYEERYWQSRTGDSTHCSNLRLPYFYEKSCF